MTVLAVAVSVQPRIQVAQPLLCLFIELQNMSKLLLVMFHLLSLTLVLHLV